jgi:hypothetical protein
MAATPRAVEVRRPRPGDGDEIRLFPCAVTRRSGPLALLRGKWKVVRLDAALPTGAAKHTQAALLRDIFGPLPFRPAGLEPALRTPSVTAVAQAIYAEHRFLDMPVLADVLEEAGCTGREILAHCRGPGPHVRGCWVLDAVLGKE